MYNHRPCSVRSFSPSLHFMLLLILRNTMDSEFFCSIPSPFLNSVANLFSLFPLNYSGHKTKPRAHCAVFPEQTVKSQQASLPSAPSHSYSHTSHIKPFPLPLPLPAPSLFNNNHLSALLQPDWTDPSLVHHDTRRHGKTWSDLTWGRTAHNPRSCHIPLHVFKLSYNFFYTNFYTHTSLASAVLLCFALLLVQWYVAHTGEVAVGVFVCLSSSVSLLSFVYLITPHYTTSHTTPSHTPHHIQHHHTKHITYHMQVTCIAVYYTMMNEQCKILVNKQRIKYSVAPKSLSFILTGQPSNGLTKTTD